MAADMITPEVSDRICKHMNDDHADAIALYAKVFGGLETASKATLLKIDPEGMDLVADVDGEETPVRIAFDHTLTDSQDAHHTLVDMVKQARTKQ